MKNKQLCKLHMKYLQFYIRRSSVGKKEFGEVQKVEDALCKRESCHGRWKGYCKRHAGEQGGTIALLQVERWERMGALVR